MNTEEIQAVRVEELARAKVNLALHITGQREDGYHTLDSLVVFPQVGDRVLVELSPRLSLDIEGPFAAQIGSNPSDNLVYKAAQLLSEHVPAATGAMIGLEKNLPVSAGIGGGSADAAAALRALAKLWGASPSISQLSKLSLSLGADVPMCLQETPARVRGIGEVIEPVSGFPSGAIVLVNPLIELPTPSVFKALEKRDNSPMPEFPAHFEDIMDLAGWLKTCRNDLQTPAISLAPQIADVLEVLSAQPETLLARMSGSGATCFALCATLPEAEAIATRLAESESNWWIAAAPF